MTLPIWLVAAIRLRFKTPARLITRGGSTGQSHTDLADPKVMNYLPMFWRPNPLPVPLGLSALRLLTLWSCSTWTFDATAADTAKRPAISAGQTGTEVHVVGEMRRMFTAHDIGPNVELAAITKSNHVYALGPLAGLQGEITVLDN